MLFQGHRAVTTARVCGGHAKVISCQAPGTRRLDQRLVAGGLKVKFLALVTVIGFTPLLPAMAQFTFTRVASTATPVPGGTGNFDFMGYPVTDGQRVYFNGADADGHVGVFGGTGGTLVTVADWNTLLPGTNETFTSFARPHVYQGVVGLEGQSATVQGLYEAGSSLLRIADTTMPLPGGGGNFQVFNEFSLSSWGMAFRANVSLPAEGIYKYTASGLATVANFETPVPGGSGTTFQALEFAVASAGGVTFTGNNMVEGAGRRLGIYQANAAGELRAVLDNTDIDPGSDTPYSAFGQPEVNDAGQMAVLAESDQNSFQSIRFWDGSQWSTVAKQGTPVPGRPEAHFTLIHPGLSLDESGAIAFRADDDANNSGIYLARGLQLLKVADLDTVIDEGKIPLRDSQALGLADNQMANGLLCFRAVTGPGEFGIYVTQVPEPSSAVLVGLGLLLMRCTAARKWRRAR